MDIYDFLSGGLARDVEMGTSVCSLSITSELVGLTFPFVLVEIRTHIFPGSEENLAGYHQRLVC